MTTIDELKQTRTEKRREKRSLKRKLAAVNERLKRLARRIKRKRRRGLPGWLPQHMADAWRRPWTDAADELRFLELIWAHGYASPNFPRAEAACNDANNTPVPASLRGECQDHAHNLEVFRHEVGDVSLPALSWFRTRAHNDAVNGAEDSRHLVADATDFTSQTVERVGRDRFVAVAERVFANGGFGRYASGSTHLDSRGFRARW